MGPKIKKSCHSFWRNDYIEARVRHQRNGGFESVAARVSTPHGACWIVRHRSFTQHPDF